MLLQVENLHFNLLKSPKRARMDENNWIKSNFFAKKPLSTQKEMEIIHLTPTPTPRYPPPT